MSYKHLSIEERACIAKYYSDGVKITKIAEMLGRNKSTISREIRRNKNSRGEYSSIGANRKYHSRIRRKRGRILELNAVSYEIVMNGLMKYWSPEQISNTMPKELRVSTSSIYRAINSSVFPKIAKTSLRRYNKKTKKSDKRGVCYDFSSVRRISERPKEVYSRKEIGHWELDTVVLWCGANGYLATMVERKTRFLICVSLPDKKAKTMADAIISELGKLPKHMVKSLTVDRGLEFTDWQRIEQCLGVNVYFCDPYSPYQRPSNENTNGLLRQFFPRRKLSLSSFPLHVAVDLINSRPRKCLNWASPSSAFLLHLY